MTWKNQIEQSPRERKKYSLLWETAKVIQLPHRGWTVSVPIETGSTLYWGMFSTQGRAEIALAEKQDAGMQLELGT